MFLIEGLPAILLAPVVLLYMTEKPSDAKWLTAPERDWLSREMAAEQADTGHAIVTLRAALGSARLWIVSLPYFCIVIAFYGISFFLPQILQSVSGFGSATVVLLSAIPYVAATVGLVVVGGRSDRVRERRWHVAVPCLIGAAGFVLTVLGPATPAYALTTLSIAAFGIWGTLGPFWTLPTAFPARHGGRGRHCAGEFRGQRRRLRRPVSHGLDPRSHRRLHRRTAGAGRRAGHRRGDRPVDSTTTGNSLTCIRSNFMTI